MVGVLVQQLNVRNATELYAYTWFMVNFVVHILAQLKKSHLGSFNLQSELGTSVAKMKQISQERESVTS